jgi:hypothetical protein
VYKTILVNGLVDEGKKLIERLESRRLQVSAALWYYFEDRWRLVIVSPVVEKEGPLRMYIRIEEALAQLKPEELKLSDISVMRPNGYEFKELRSALERSGDVRPARRISTLKDIVFEDRYIYRWPDRRSTPQRG